MNRRKQNSLNISNPSKHLANETKPLFGLVMKFGHIFMLLLDMNISKLQKDVIIIVLFVLSLIFADDRILEK